MNGFPAVDPIPLPAPVWLFKGLHILTLGLHFVTVEMLLGGLLVAIFLNLLAQTRQGRSNGADPANAAAALARRLPVVMTFVINLGVPPLLFAQVLYGRAIYTSSVLIGVYWIGVVFLLMACYWLLYRFSARAAEGRSGWWLGLGALVLAGVIARIYSTNMTLMLRPEVWNAMYSASGGGLHLPPADPTLTPRWLFMLLGGLSFAGLWMIWLSGGKNMHGSLQTYLVTKGGLLAAVMAVPQVLLANWVVKTQAASVQTALAGHAVYSVAAYVWIGAYGLVLLIGLWALVGKPKSILPGALSLATAVVAMLAMTIYRDGLRDLTLLGKGYDVWQRTVVTNWSVVVIFLVVLVIGLVAIGWLISVMMRAKPVSEKVV